MHKLLINETSVACMPRFLFALTAVVALLVAAGISNAEASITLVSHRSGLPLDEYRNRLSLCTDPHSTTIAGADAAALCECEAGFTLDQGSCVACVAGLLKSTVGNHPCVSCAVGSSSLPAATSNDDCICTKGRFLDDQGCSVCVEGSYKSYVGNGVCSSCHSTMTTESTGSSAIEACVCRPGHYGVDGGAADGSGCAECPENSYKGSTGSAATCVSCPENSMTHETGNVAINACQCNRAWTGVAADGCSVCPFDTYKDVEGSSGCQSCPPAATAPAESDDRADCLCRPGYTGSTPDTCAVCEAGSFKGSVGGSACTPCGLNTFSKEGAASCTDCGPHLESEGGQADCQCSAGYFSDNIAACQGCAPGTFKAGPGNSSTLCLPCADHTYTAGAASTCLTCPGNSVATSPGNIYACECNAGYKRTSADTCTKCPLGTAKGDVGNAASCSPCGVDTFQPGEGGEACLSCSTETEGVSSTYGATGAQSIEACKCGATFERSVDSCVSCASNFYCPGQNGKVACPIPGGLSQGGSDAESDCFCEAGYFWSTESGASCEICPEHHYCVEGTVTPVECTSSSSAPAQSQSEDACVCNVGFEPEE